MSGKWYIKTGELEIKPILPDPPMVEHQIFFERVLEEVARALAVPPEMMKRLGGINNITPSPYR